MLRHIYPCYQQLNVWHNAMTSSNWRCQLTSAQHDTVNHRNGER